MIIEIVEIKKNGVVEPIHPGNEKIVSVIMPTTDIAQAVQSARRMIDNAGMPMRMIIAHDSIRQGYIKTLNSIAKEVASKFIVYVAQDALAGKNWLKIAYQNIVKHEKSLLAFNDGKYDGDLATFGLVKKSFCEKFYGAGNIFFEGYHSHRADDELTLLAKLHQQLAYAPTALMLEVDYRLQREINPDDVKLFNLRKQSLLMQYGK
jgi:hypothetical protein